ncbi:retrovirus-related pol polyprotein from transposon TNT 1-94 [Tanacetum coccineum]
MLKIDVEPIAPRLLNNRTSHSDYLRHTQEQAAILREIVEQGKSQNPLNNSLDSACKYTKRIQELLIIIRQTCPSIKNSSDKLVVVTPKNKDKRVRFTEPVTSSGNTNTKTTSSSNLVSNKPMLSSTRVKPSTSASGSSFKINTKKVKSQGETKLVLRRIKHFKLNVNSEHLCVKCNGYMLSDNHDLFVLDFINDVNARTKSKFVKKNSKRKDYQTAEVPLRKPTAQESVTPKPVVTLVYSRRPKKSKTNVPVVKIILKSISANKKEPSKSWGSIVSDVPSSSLNECRDMMASSPICLLSKASKTKSWLWHRRLSHLNFGAINHLARHGLVRGLPKLKFEKDLLCFACAMGKSKKKPHKPKSEDTNQEKLYLLHMDHVANAVAKYFDELTAMASEHSSSEPVLHEMTPTTISSGLMPNPPPSKPFIPPSRTDWDLLFQLLFDELLTPPPTIDYPTPKVVALIAEVFAPKSAASTGSPSSTIVDQDAPSPSNSQTTPETQSLIIPNDVEEDNHDLDVAYMNNNPFFGIPIPENDIEASSSPDVIPTIVQTAAPNSEHITK